MARARNLTAEQRTEIARKGAAKRSGQKKELTMSIYLPYK